MDEKELDGIVKEITESDDYNIVKPWFKKVYRLKEKKGFLSSIAESKAGKAGKVCLAGMGLAGGSMALEMIADHLMPEHSIVSEASASDNEYCQDDYCPPITIGHGANGYKVTLEGYFRSSQFLEIDDAYTQLEKLLKKPAIINSDIFFEDGYAQTIDANDSGVSFIALSGKDVPEGRLIEFLPKIQIKKTGKIKKVFLHEFGHCWFAYMEKFVPGGKEWIENFNKENPLTLKKKMGHLTYPKEEAQEEIQAIAFKDHVLGKKDYKIFEEGFRLYNRYVDEKDGDLRQKIIPK